MAVGFWQWVFHHITIRGCIQPQADTTHLRSVRPLCGKLFVNIDTVHMPVYVVFALEAPITECITCRYKEGDLLNVAISFLGERFGVRDLAFKNSSDPKFRELQNFFKGVRIRYKKEVWQRIRPGTSPPPYKRILRLVPQAGSETFMWGDRKCSVKVIGYSIL